MQHPLKVVLGCFLVLLCWANMIEAQPSLLVFSKTEKFRHQSIPTAQEAIRQMAVQENWQVTFTEDATAFESDSLHRYEVVVFLLTSGNVFNTIQEEALKKYIEQGGGFVGLHSATDTEYDWLWYHGLVGAQFSKHPKPQEATLQIVNILHPATQHLKPKYEITFTDEWYDFRAPVLPEVNVLLNLGETIYPDEKKGGNHPIAWYRYYEGGRSFVTGLGHLEETYANPVFLQHLRGGIKWAAGLQEVLPAGK